MRIASDEVTKFFEQYKEQFYEVDESFEGFDKRLLRFIKTHSHKRAIILTCRVHPGEPQSSHMLNGLMDKLMKEESQPLRENFVVRIVPMLNPDGVVYGNYRCSLLGCDLNRKWNCANRLLHPTVYHTLQMMTRMRNSVKI